MSSSAQSVAHRAHPAGGRHEHAARTLDRLGVEGGDALRSAERGDLGAQRGGRGGDDRLRVGPDRVAVGVVRRDLVLPVVGHAEAGVEDRQRGEAGADRRRAVIALLERDELVLLRLAAGVPVVADEADRAVDRVRAAEGEVDVVEIARRQLGEPGGEADRRLRAEAEVAGRIGQGAQLALGGGDDALLAVAGVDAPEAGEAVDEGAPLGVGHGRALGGGEHADAGGLVPAPAGDRVDEMGAVEFDQRVGKHGRVEDYLGRLGHQAPPDRAILGGAGAQVLCPPGPAAQSRAVLAAKSPQEMPRQPARPSLGAGRSRPPPATSCGGAGRYGVFCFARPRLRRLPSGGGPYCHGDAGRPPAAAWDLTHMTFRPKYVTFDCYGTLINFDMAGAARRIYGAQLSEPAMERLHQGLLAAYRLDEVLGAWKPYAEVVHNAVERTCKRNGVAFRPEDAQTHLRGGPDLGPAPGRAGGPRQGRQGNPAGDPLERDEQPDHVERREARRAVPRGLHRRAGRQLQAADEGLRVHVRRARLRAGGYHRTCPRPSATT